MNEVRVLQVALSLNPGGTERLVIDLARRLHAELPMAICCLDEAGTWAGEVRSAGIDVTALGRKPGFHPSLGAGVARAARAHRANVVHAHHYSPFVYSAPARLVHPGLKVVFTEHGRLSDAGPSPRRRQVNRVLRHLAGGVFTVSEDVRQHLIAEGFLESQVGVIYNGIDVGPIPDEGIRTTVRAELGAGEGTTVIGTIARLDPVKDLGTLLRALALLHALDVLLVIVGDGPERTSLEALARELELGSRVRFLGHREDARRWLSGCDIYANSSISEGVSLTILEAMSAGLPVAATRVGGTPEVVDDRSGRLVEARDPAGLATALASLASDPIARQKLGRSGRTVAEAQFTIDGMVEAYRRAYERLSGR